jgi:hypothetical protein
MKTTTKNGVKNKTFDFAGFTTLKVSELLKIRGGDTTTSGDTTKKQPD